MRKFMLQFSCVLLTVGSVFLLKNAMFKYEYPETQLQYFIYDYKYINIIYFNVNMSYTIIH